jgi:amino acid transporter
MAPNVEIADVLGEPAAASRAEVGLKPSMHGFGALLITVSCLSPSVGVFVVGSDIIRQAGTGAFLCFVFAAILGVAMAAVYGELSSAFPTAGGEYTIFGQALGRPWGAVALSINLVGLSLAQSITGLGVATYLAPLVPGLPPAPTAAVIVAIVTGVAILNIRVNALITGVFLAVEISALILLAVVGFLHPSRGAASLMHPMVLGVQHGLTAPGLVILGVAAAGGVYAFNGYGAVVFLGEEMHEAPRRIAGVVFLALGVGMVAELAPLAGVLVGAPDLTRLLSAEAPISTFLADRTPPWLAKAMSLGVALAIFNTMIAVALVAGRQLYASGRDRLWPAPISAFLGQIHPRLGSPWTATIVMGSAGLAGCLLSQKILVIVLGNGNVALYTGLCFAAIVGRRSGATGHAGYRMPLYPLAPVAALAALAAVVWFDLHDPDGAIGLVATLATVGLALVYYAVFLRRRTEWGFHTPAQAVEASPEASVLGAE